jgi:hypothetical protein
MTSRLSFSFDASGKEIGPPADDVEECRFAPTLPLAAPRKPAAQSGVAPVGLSFSCCSSRNRVTFLQLMAHRLNSRQRSDFVAALYFDTLLRCPEPSL